MAKINLRIILKFIDKCEKLCYTCILPYREPKGGAPWPEPTEPQAADAC